MDKIKSRHFLHHATSIDEIAAHYRNFSRKMNLFSKPSVGCALLAVLNTCMSPINADLLVDRNHSF